MFTWIPKNQIHLLALPCIPIIHYFKVLLENTHLIKLNQFIVPMDVYHYAKNISRPYLSEILFYGTLTCLGITLKKKLFVTPKDEYSYAKN